MRWTRRACADFTELQGEDGVCCRRWCGNEGSGFFGLLAFPLCGGAPTFLCLPQRKVGKRKRLTPLALKRVPWLGGDSGASGICVLAHSALVTRPSCFRRRCARRSGTSQHRARKCASSIILPA